MAGIQDKLRFEGKSIIDFFHDPTNHDNDQLATTFAARSLYQAVEDNDLLALNAWRDLHSIEAWNQLFEDPARPGINRGSIGHWAVWFRHWRVLALWLARGGRPELLAEGTVGWMTGLNLTEYSEKLDREAGHDAFEHAKWVNGILTRRPLPGPLVRRPLAWGTDATTDSEELVAIVEENDIANLGIALIALGAETLRTRILVPSYDNAYLNGGTLAHWAVWYRHWHLLEHLLRMNAADLTGVKGTGNGWMGGRTVSEYVHHLATMTKHEWYNLVPQLQSLTASSAPPPVTPTPATTIPVTSVITPEASLLPSMSLTIKTLTGREIWLGNISPTDTIATLKQKIEEREAIPPSHQRLIYAGREMDNQLTLSAYNIQSESTVHLVLSLRGHN